MRISIFSSTKIQGLAVLAVSLIVCGCAPTPKKLEPKVGTAVYEVTTDDGQKEAKVEKMTVERGTERRRRTEIGVERDGVYKMTSLFIYNTPKAEIFLVHPNEPKYDHRWFDTKNPDFEIDAPKMPFFAFQKAEKIGTHPCQLWRQIQKYESSVLVTDLWFGEDTGCMVRQHVYPASAPTKGTKRELLEYTSGPSPDSHFEAPEGYTLGKNLDE